MRNDSIFIKPKKLFLVIIFGLFPSIIYAHGEQIFNLGISSVIYLFFGGLIIGLFESKIIISFSESVLGLGKIIGYNYLVLITSYLIYCGLIWINLTYFNSSVMEVKTLDNYEIIQHKAILKCFFSIIFYFIVLIGLKYWVYNKKIFIDNDNENNFILVLIPNIIILGISFVLIFRDLVWLFGG